MGRLCERPGCSEVAVAEYGFDAGRRLVWLAAHEPSTDRTRAGVLCRRHAEALVVPRDWRLDDRRRPRTESVAPAESVVSDGPVAPTAPAAPAEPVSRVEAVASPGLTASTESAAPVTPTEPVAPAEWDARFDVDDDLGGVLAADSPLLARAFRGTDRRR